MSTNETQGAGRPSDPWNSKDIDHTGSWSLRGERLELDTDQVVLPDTDTLRWDPDGETEVLSREVVAERIDDPESAESFTDETEVDFLREADPAPVPVRLDTLEDERTVAEAHVSTLESEEATTWDSDSQTEEAPDLQKSPEMSQAPGITGPRFNRTRPMTPEPPPRRQRAQFIVDRPDDLDVYEEQTSSAPSAQPALAATQPSPPASRGAASTVYIRRSGPPSREVDPFRSYVLERRPSEEVEIEEPSVLKGLLAHTGMTLLAVLAGTTVGAVVFILLAPHIGL